MGFLWALEVAVSERGRLLNSADTIWVSPKFTYMIDYLETRFIPETEMIPSDLLCNSWKVTYTPFRIEYYLRHRADDMVNLILTDSNTQFTSNDLIFILKLLVKYYQYKPTKTLLRIITRIWILLRYFHPNQ